MRDKIKQWLDANVWDGDDRSGAKNDWAKFDPDELQELVEDCFNDLQGWVSVDIEQPQEDFEVLACCGDNVAVCIFRVNASGHYYFEDMPEATHWMPLPEPHK